MLKALEEFHEPKGKNIVEDLKGCREPMAGTLYSHSAYDAQLLHSFLPRGSLSLLPLWEKYGLPNALSLCTGPATWKLPL